MPARTEHTCAMPGHDGRSWTNGLAKLVAFICLRLFQFDIWQGGSSSRESYKKFTHA